MSAQQASAQWTDHRSLEATPEQIREFVEAVSAMLPGSSIEIDAPLEPAGEWFIDVVYDEFRPHVAWRPSFGFGLFTSEEGFGDYPNEVYRKPDLAAHRVLQLHEQWQTSRQMTPAWLAQLRQLVGTPQADLAALLSLNQPAISRFEKRGDVKISTLTSYLGAMGGRLEMRVHFKDLDVSIDLPSHGAASS